MDETQKREKKWRMTQGAGFLFPGFLALAIIVIMVLIQIPEYHPLSSAQKMTQTLEELGYTPWDSTEEYRDAWVTGDRIWDLYESLRKDEWLGDRLRASVSAEADGFHLVFFETTRPAGAGAVSAKLYSYFQSAITIPQHSANKRTDEYQAVYQEKDGQNYFYVRLENTVLYIRWEDGEAGRVTEILDQIGYPGKDVLKD